MFVPRARSAERLRRLGQHVTGARAVLVSGGTADASPADEVIAEEQALRALCRAILAAIGSAADEQQIVADHLVEAMLKGHDSHGVQMLSGYIISNESGLLHPNSRVEVVGRSGPLLTVDAGGFESGGFGMVAAREATLLAVDTAKREGVAILMLRNCHHIGRVGTYAELAASHGVITTLYTNGNQIKPLVSPFGGAEARLATNPYTCGLPAVASDGGPLVLDFATSLVANGKVMNYANKGTKFDDNVLLTAEGVATNDPSAMWTQQKAGGGSRQGGLDSQGGSLMPFGLHKGSGLALMCALLAGGLSGGGTERPDAQRGPGPILNHLFGVFVDPAAVEKAGGATVAEMKEEMKSFIDYYKSSRPIDPERPVLAPGEPERAAMAERKANGIAIAAHTWETLSDTARRVGVAQGVIDATLLHR